MDRRFANALAFRFDEVEDRGFVEITFDELLRWYDRQRISKGVWQDIIERWEERTNVPLLVSERRNSYLFVWGEGLSLNEDSWLAHVNSMVQGAD